MDLALPLAIAHRRVEPADSLQLFPTPPWATRALFHYVLGRKGFGSMTVEEPACGLGHMAYVLGDYFGTVRSSDIAPYGFGEVRDFLDAGAWDVIERPDWIITNPPFGNLTVRFYERALARARRGVAMFVRTTQLEGIRRFQLYRGKRPAIVAKFAERVPLHKDRWEPDGATMTAYCWIVWRTGADRKRTDLDWIPPCRMRLHLTRDVELFGEAQS